jgi:polar amino acid transport system substrate-binding protein
LVAVEQGKADAALLDEVVAMVSLSGGKFPSLSAIVVPLEELDFIYAPFSMKQEFIDKYNEFLKVIKASGVHDDMVKRWLKTDFDENRRIPEIPLTNKNGVLKVAIIPTYPPFIFLGDNRDWSGFDIEQFRRFAQFLKMDIEFTAMDFGALLPYVASGKCDIAQSIYATEERKKSMIFGDPTYIGKTVVVYRKDGGIGAMSGITVKDGVDKKENAFIAWLKKGIERNLITDNRWKMIANGLGVTMLIAAAAQLFGTIFGSFVCFLLTRKNRFVRTAAKLYCGIIRGTPMVVLLMIAYYIIFGSAGISNIAVAIAAFAFVVGVDIAQNLKGSIDTVDPVEIEAARSIGFSSFRAFIVVTLPQAVRRALPAYTNGFVELVKATAIVGFIAIQDLTRAGDIIRSRTYDAYFPLLFVALVYLTVTTICVMIFKLIVKKVNGAAAQ